MLRRVHILDRRQMYLVDDRAHYAIQVLDGCIPGSVISESTNSETKMANAIVIHGDGDERWLLVDTPGFEDSDGPADRIVNAVSIAKVMKVCTSLRIVLLINQSDISNARQSLCQARVDRLEALRRLPPCVQVARHLGAQEAGRRRY